MQDELDKELEKRGHKLSVMQMTTISMLKADELVKEL
jgi:hypothetical protein